MLQADIPLIHPDHLPEALRENSQRKWDEFSNSLETAGISLPEVPMVLDTIRGVFTFSDFIADSCTRNPRLLDELIRSGDLTRAYTPGAYSGILEKIPDEVVDETQLGKHLRYIRRREMVRIAWRDLCGWADLFETMADLSAFADACLETALTFLYQKLLAQFGQPTGPDGEPQELVVISMGKLGGWELNFSSDIDLIFAYPQTGKTTGADTSIQNEEFFTRLCRLLINVIGTTTPEGIVFRIDLRLRPDGENGPLVMSFDNMESYYQNQGREWERYAWIKARISAGDKEAGTELLNRLKPFVFRRYLDYGAFDSLREMKEKIVLEVKQKHMKDNIKLGAGGIREIEFFGQAFQLLRGGVIPALQERSILSVLKTLYHNNFLPKEGWRQLENAYIFLRTTEHRLQEVSDRQTHGLPANHTGRRQLALSMGFSSWDDFVHQMETHRKAVHEHFNGLLAIKDTETSSTQKKDELTGVWQDHTKSDHNKHILLRSGFDRPEEVLSLLTDLNNDPATRAMSNEGRKRLDKLVPLILEAVGLSDRPGLILNRIIDLIKTIGRRTNYFALLLENPATLTHLVELADSSPWIISFLSQHPVLLDELLDPRTLYSPPDKKDMEAEIKYRLAQVPADDLEYQIEQLCIFKQVNTLRVSAADVSDVLPLMRISDHLTEIAEIVLSEVLNISWNHLAGKHGVPLSAVDNTPCERGFIAIAYGKLGGIELGYTSDLDLVFLHAGASGQTQGGKQPIENGHFYARLGQRMINLLTAHTRAGRLYEVDMRLRPSGDAGPLVSHINGFKEYQLNDAWTWEHQALIRARVIAGDKTLYAPFEAIRKTVLSRSRDKGTLQKDVRTMRERLRKEIGGSGPDSFDLKQDAGGIVDIEFIVQYLVLLNAHRYNELTEWTDNVRLLETLAETGVIDKQTDRVLKDAYLTYRSAVHRLGLQNQPSLVPAHEFVGLREKIIHLWHQFLEPGVAN